MLKVVGISGSPRRSASNMQLLVAIKNHFRQIDLDISNLLPSLPLFGPDIDQAPYAKEVERWRAQIAQSDSIIICTPVYIYNMPAMLKNALEWLTTSGEMAGKKVLAITFTPHPPRGEKAMQSLLWSLTALDANVVCSLPLYKTELRISDAGTLEGDESIEMLNTALDMLR